MRVLITGGTGFLGRHMRSCLLGETPAPEILSLGRRDCDLAGDPGGIARVLGEFHPDVILHLAGLISGTEAEFFRVNEQATAQLCEAVETSCPDALVVVCSSTSVYGH